MRFFLIFFALLICNSLFTQRENANWHFGCFAGINFAEDGAISQIPSSLQSREGTASVSDSEGNLLFYTDGLSIYNAAGTEVVTGLLGDPSSTTSAISFPVTGNENQYWIFTSGLPNENIGLNYYRYNIETESLLEGPVKIVENQTEKIAVFKSPDLSNYWLVTLDRNGAYIVFSVDNSVTRTSVTNSFPQPVSTRQASSYLKFSEDGTKLASALPERFNDTPTHLQGGFVNIYDFDPTTGTLTNPFSPTVLDFNNDDNGNRIGFPFGLQFSPGGRFLYVSVIGNNDFGFEGGQLYQYDLEDSNINLSRTLIGQAPMTEMNYGSLQLGPNGKIYMAIEAENESTSSCSCFGTHPFLSVINKPDAVGLAADFVQDAISLTSGNFTDNCGFSSPGGAKLGLPTFITIGADNSLPISLTSFSASLSDKNNVLLNWQTDSESQSATFHVEHSVDGINWSDISMLLGAGNTTTQRRYEHIHNQPAIGLNFYRLRHTNFDASFTHSKVQIVKYDGTGLSFRVYPNPATNKVNLQIPGSLNAYKIYLIDTSGKLVIEQLASNPTLNVARLPQGTYFIKITTTEGSVYQRLVIVKRA